MEYFVLYLLGNIVELRNSLIFFGIIVPITYGFYYIFKILDYGESEVKFPKKILIACWIMVVVGIMIPTERSVQYMAAYYVGKNVVQTETVKKLTELVNVKLDEEIKETLKTNSK